MSTHGNQRWICERFGSVFVPVHENEKVGIAMNVRDGLVPLNGLRHSPKADTTGWYIWAGEHLSDEADFFQPLHVAHLVEWCPVVLKYLGLAPGWRFIVDGAYEDVWFDQSLLDDP